MLSMVTVTGHLIRPDGKPAVGQVLFRLDQPLLATDEDVIVVEAPVVVLLDEQGEFSVDLVATNDDATLPQGATYRVWRQLQDEEPSDTHVILDKDASPIDLLDLLGGQ